MDLSQASIILAPINYITNNRFAYKYDTTKSIPMDELKIWNYVPTYDKW